MRPATSCLQCRQTKRKCRKDGKNACDGCNRRGQPCSLAPTPKTPKLRPPVVEVLSESHIEDAGVLSQLSQAQVLILVDSYFALIHDRPHSLFHRLTFVQDFTSGRIDQALLLSMCALSSHLSEDDQVRKLGPQMTSAAKEQFLRNIGRPSVSNIQTSILLANLCAAELDPHAEVMYFSIANRMSQILQLDSTSGVEGHINQQVCIRICWSLVMADFWCSAGLMIERQLDHANSSLPLPEAEDVLQNAHPGQMKLQHTPPGLWAHMISLVKVFGLIRSLHEQLVRGRINHNDLERQIERVADQLDDWATKLPADVILNDENLHRHVGRGLGGPFVALHLGFHHYCTLLFFHSLDQKNACLPSAEAFSKRCRGSAVRFSHLLQISREEPGCEAIYATVGQMIVVSSSVLLHTLLFGKDTELPQARECLIHNFAALIQLKKFWPSTDVMIRRLYSFQSACEQLVDDSTHSIDQWMFSFLYSHSKTLVSRSFTEDASSVSSGNQAPPMPVEYRQVEHGRRAIFDQALNTLHDSADAKS